MERNEEVLTVVTEYFDPHSEILKQYLLKYYVSSNEVEMKDLTTGRKFLKRTPVPASSSVSVADFYVGGHIILFSRNMKIVDYGDDETRMLLGSAAEQTAVIISSKLMESGAVGNVVEVVERAELTVVGMRAVQQQLGHASPVMNDVQQSLGDGKVVVLFQGSDSLNKARRALEEDGRYCSEVHCTSTAEEAAKAKEVYLDRRQGICSTNKDGDSSCTSCTCCVIKPHAIKARQVGAILQAITSQGYDIASLELFRLDHDASAEFLEVYEGGAVKNFHSMVVELCSGPVIAMKIHCGSTGSCRSSAGDMDDSESSVVSTFRSQVAGPWDVSMAKELYPTTIRARFGVDNVKNAIHCTDLPRDGGSECQFFFEILAGGGP